MSIKNMVAKLAVAFAAKKGMEAFNRMGGVEGVRDMLAGKGTQTAGATGTTGLPGGLGGLLDSLGSTGGSGRSPSPIEQSLGGLFGTLAGALGNPAHQQQAEADLQREFQMNDIQNDDDAKPIVRAMVQMARADGAIDAQEQSALFDLMDDATPAEQATLREALQEPVNPKAIADDTPPHARKEVYTAALLVGNPDRPEERSFLSSLANALGLSHEDVSRLHAAVGKSNVA